MNKWAYRRFIDKRIHIHAITAKNREKANLFEHKGKGDGKHKPCRVIILLHGDYSHPFSLMHFADHVGEHTFSIFSIHLLFNRGGGSNNFDLLKQSIDQIEKLIALRGGELKDIVGIGHSRGATEFAHYCFASKDRRVKQIISIDGRMHLDDKCPVNLKMKIETIHASMNNLLIGPRIFHIFSSINRHIPKIHGQIKAYTVIDGTDHLNVLFNQKTIEQVNSLLEKGEESPFNLLKVLKC